LVCASAHNPPKEVMARERAVFRIESGKNWQIRWLPVVISKMPHKNAVGKVPKKTICFKNEVSTENTRI